MFLKFTNLKYTIFQYNNSVYNKRGSAKLSTCTVLASTRVTKPAPSRDVIRLISHAKPTDYNIKNNSSLKVKTQYYNSYNYYFKMFKDFGKMYNLNGHV